MLADSGYRGLIKIHENSKYPIKHKEDIKGIPEQERKEYNRSVSSPRMKVEHVIGRTKKYAIARERNRTSRKNFGKRYSLICGIVDAEYCA